jgi:hypothetical protein
MRALIILIHYANIWLHIIITFLNPSLSCAPVSALIHYANVWYKQYITLFWKHISCARRSMRAIHYANIWLHKLHKKHNISWKHYLLCADQCAPIPLCECVIQNYITLSWKHYLCAPINARYPLRECVIT